MYNRWFQILHPYRQLKLYLEDMLTIVGDRVHGTLSPASKQTLFTVNAIILLYLLESAKYSALFSFKPTSSRVRLTFYEMMFFLDAPLQVNFFNLAYYLQTAYFLYVSYYYASKEQHLIPLKLTYKILFKGHRSYFLDKSGKDGKKPIVEKIRKIAKAYMIPCRYCMALLIVFILFYHLRSTLLIIDDWQYFFQSIPGFLALFYLQLNSLIFDFTFAWLGMANSVASSVILVFSAIALLRLKQVNQLLSKKPSKKSLVSLQRFYRLHTETLLDILQSNRLIGVLIFVHMLLITPLNAYLMSGLLTSKYNLKASFFFWSIVLFQYDGILALHFLATLYTKAIHQCGSRLLSLSALYSRQSLPLVDRTRLQMYTEKFHTEERYGLTYGSTVTIMSLASLAKFIILYTELLMYSYQLFNY